MLHFHDWIEMHYASRLHDGGRSGRWSHMKPSSPWREYLFEQWLKRHPEAESWSAKQLPSGLFTMRFKASDQNKRHIYFNSLHEFIQKLEHKSRWHGAKKRNKAIKRLRRIAKAHPDYEALRRGWWKEKRARESGERRVFASIDEAMTAAREAAS